MKVIEWYTDKLIKKPFITKSITSFFTFGLGDFICQSIEGKLTGSKKSYDLKRILRQACFGFAVTPYFHLQFNIIIPKLFPGSGPLNLVKIIAYDQTIGASLFLIIFFSYMDTMNGVNINQSIKDTFQKLPSCMIANWKLWPLAQALNFTIVPPPYRVLFANSVGIIWNTYLSFIQNNKPNKTEENSLKSDINNKI